LLTTCLLSIVYSFSTLGTTLGRSLFSQPGGRLELYQAIEPIVTAATKPTTYTKVKAMGK